MILTLGGAPALAATHHARRTRAPVGATYPDKDAALIVDGETGKTLYARNADALRHPASLTKMMTLYLLFEALKKHTMTLQTEMPVSAHAAAQRPTKLYLRRGQTIDVDTAVRAIVVRSANDVAVVIAEALGGTESHFAEMMTAKAHEMGMRDTNFHNASGLPDPLQITTASDLAILARHLAYDFPQYFPYFATPGFTYKGTYYPTHDNLIGRYDGADGIKTGYTSGSGFNLVSSVVRGGVNVIGVVMGGVTAYRRDVEMVHLLDAAFTRIDADPTLVARAPVPWRNVAQATTVTAAAGFIPDPPTPRPVLVAGLRTAPADPDDEDAAESQRDPGEDFSVIHAETPPPPALPATPPTRPAIRPQPRPDALLAANIPVNPKLRPEVGEGDIGDPGIPADAAHIWTIQIGAYTDKALAQAQLASYAEKSMDVLGQAERLVVPFRLTDGQTLYRARFGLFAEGEARQVCGQLTKRGQTCFAAIQAR